MSKQEFLKQLAFRLEHLSVEERDDIINYYDELIEDKKDREYLDEETVINNLGSLDDIVRRVAPKSSETKIYYDEDKKVEKGPNEEKDTKLIMSIISIPVCLVIGAVLFSIGVTIAMVAISLISTAIVCIGLAITSFATNYLVALYEISMALILIGLAVIIVPCLSKLFKLLIAWIKKMYNKYFSALKEGK